MAIKTVNIIKKITSKNKPIATITSTALAPSKKPNVTFVDIGQQAPKGYEFVDEKGKSLGTTIDRVGGYTVVGRAAGEGGTRAGGSYGGGTIVSTQGGVNSQIAMAAEKTPMFPMGSKGVQKEVTLPPEVQSQVVRQQQLQKATENQRITNQGQTRAEQTYVKKEVPLAPYVTRKEPTIKGYTSSGKPIVEQGEAVLVNPFAEQYGQIKERKATPEELSLLEFEEKKQKEERIGAYLSSYSPSLYGEYLSTKDIQQVKPKDLPEWAKLSKGTQVKIQTKLQEINYGKNYNLEDIYSYKELAGKGQFSPIVRKGAYDFGNLISSIGVKLGVTKSPAIQAKVRAVVGEGALFSFFSPAFTTTAQTMVKLNEPAKVKFLGVSQTGKKGLVQTDVVFTAKKAGTTYKGIATGISESKSLTINGKPLKNFYETFSQTKGVASEFSFKIPQRITYKDTLAFASEESGLAWTVDKKTLASLSQGAMGVGKKASEEGFKYLSFGTQYTGNKGISALMGSTISEVGRANYVGLLFPIKPQPSIFIPLSAKGGQFALSEIGKEVLKVPSLSIEKEIGLGLTKSSVQAFATTLPATAVVSYATPVASLFRIQPSPTFISPKTTLSIKSIENEQIKFNTRELQITKDIQQVKPRNIFSSASITETSQQQKQQEKQVFKQPLKLKQPSRLITPKPPSFNISIKPPKPLPFKVISLTPKQIRNKDFTVLFRRFGKFKPIAKTNNLKQAFDIGKFKTGTTLGATFKVEGTTKQPTNILGYKTKKTKEGTLFIEKPKFRLSTPTEKAEIQIFKRVKGGLGRYGRAKR